MSIELGLTNTAAEAWAIGRPMHDPADDSAPVGHQHMITAAVAEIVERRATIKRVKGMPMLVFGIDAPDSCQLLRRQSQNHNVKLRFIAEQIARDFPHASRQQPPANRQTYDELLMTAHIRSAPPIAPDDPGADGPVRTEQRVPGERAHLGRRRHRHLHLVGTSSTFRTSTTRRLRRIARPSLIHVAQEPLALRAFQSVGDRALVGCGCSCPPSRIRP